MTIYEVKMFSSPDGKLLSTYIGKAKDEQDAKIKCLYRARDIGKLDAWFCKELVSGISICNEKYYDRDTACKKAYYQRYVQRYVRFHVISYVPN